MEWRDQNISEEDSNGWIILDRSPLELKHEPTNTFVKGMYAIAILDDLLYQKNNPKP